MSSEKIMKGRLEDLPILDILQILTTQQKTGTLSVESKDARGLVVLRHGKIVYAISPGSRLELVELLKKVGLLGDTEVEMLLQLQRKDDYRKRLTELVVDAGLVSQEKLHQLISMQIENAMYDLFTWTNGDFSFELDRIYFDHHVAVDPENLSLDLGLNPQLIIARASQLSSAGDESPAETKDDAVSWSFSPVVGEAATPQLTASLVDHVSRRPPDERMKEESFTGERGLSESTESAAFTPSVGEELESREMADPAVPVDLGFVLIVDDESYFRRIISDCLQKKGFQVLGTSEVKEALHEISEMKDRPTTPILVAIVDVVMPESEGDGILGGFELLNRIQMISPGLPVLMMSSAGDPELQYKAIELGARQFFAKPSSKGHSFKDSRKTIESFVDNLAETIQQLFAEHFSRVEPAAAPARADKLPPAGSGHVEGREIPGQSAEEPGANLASGHDSVMPVDRIESIERVQPTRSGRRDSDESGPTSRSETPELPMIERLKGIKTVEEGLSLLLRDARTLFDEGILYLVRKNDIMGIAGFSRDQKESLKSDFYRRIRFSRTSPTIYAGVLEKKERFIGRLLHPEGRDQIERELGELYDGEHYISPIIAAGRPIALFHCCNSLTFQPLKNIDRFEGALQRAGEIMGTLLRIKLAGSSGEIHANQRLPGN
jgi:two-component system, chemotaxis family, chemotaxis protein CheY